jgi:O-6-methylguanine DNA methyltransferase
MLPLANFLILPGKHPWYHTGIRRLSHQEQRLMASVVTAIPSKKGLKKVLARPVGITGRCHMAMIPTAWGMCGIVWKNHEDENHSGFVHQPSGLLSHIRTPGLSAGDLRRGLMQAYPGCSEVLPSAGKIFHPEIVPDWFSELARFLQGYYSAALRHQTAPEFADQWDYWRSRLDWSQVTPFQRQVLEIVGRIPCSQTVTYGQIAARIGKPSAARAVGAAVGANPWPVLIPCHRVMGASGKLTGFSATGGIEAKRRMLELEQSNLF